MVAVDASKLVSEFDDAFKEVKLVRPVTFNDVNLLLYTSRVNRLVAGDASKLVSEFEYAYKKVKLVRPVTFNDVNLLLDT